MNILGDSFGAGLVDHLSKAELEKLPKSNIQMQNLEKGRRDDNDVHFVE